MNSIFALTSSFTSKGTENEMATSQSEIEKSPSVPPARPNMNEILEDTRDFARIWDLYGHLLNRG